MTTAELLVTVTGLAVIAWINWYFFVAGSRAAPKRVDDASAGPPDARR